MSYPELEKIDKDEWQTINSFIEFLSLISVIIIGVATFVMILKYRIINGVDESGENT